MKVVMDVEDSEENRQFFRDFEECLKVRFRQIEIRMTTHLIEVV